ncbi:hypothetical protein DERP_003545 [Dermatophagoides pteronyssinus]|uniref:Uncharacterized protein n=1 Tax=Dermatophagoides pteronyssinus TaxID=6956 RepID=A0ABQ8JLG8_DERPT|nr:hypothetical protein DERP_003545 [Dermatophagoides pteronyssinus]
MAIQSIQKILSFALYSTIYKQHTACHKIIDKLNYIALWLFIPIKSIFGYEDYHHRLDDYGYGYDDY